MNIRYFLIAMLILSSKAILASSIDLPVQQLAAIYPPREDQIVDHGLRLLIQFQIPDSLASKRLIYSEARMPIPLIQYRDTTFSYEVSPIMTGWSENTVGWNTPWQNSGGDIDSSITFNRFFTINSSDSLNIDLTIPIREQLQSGRPNYGFMIKISFLNRRGLRINIDNYLSLIRSSLRLRIKYDNGPIGY